MFRKPPVKFTIDTPASLYSLNSATIKQINSEGWICIIGEIMSTRDDSRLSRTKLSKIKSVWPHFEASGVEHHVHSVPGPWRL